MSKKAKTNATPKSTKTLLFSIIPVVSALVLIFVVATVVIIATNANDKKPTFKGEDDIYFTYEDLEVTKGNLYTNMKIEYGAAELIRMIDEKLYASEIAKIDEDALYLYILDSLFGVEDLEDFEGDLQEEWNKVINSLRMNNLLKDSDIDDKDINNKDSKIWKVVKDNYRLQYARNEWAKKAYVEKYKADKEKAEEDLFTEKEIEDAYSKYYESTSYGLFIPFTSEAAAKAMMDKYGINTQNSTSINEKGWISSEFDYNSNADKTDYKLTDKQVLDIFYNMYNEVLGYYAESGKVIDLEKHLDKTINQSRVFYNGVNEIKESISDLGTISGKVTLPTEITVTGGTNIAITWELVENTVLALENNVLTLKSTEDATSSTSVTLKATFKMNVSETETYTTTLSLTQSVKSKATPEADKVIENPTMEAIEKYVLSTEFMDSFQDEEKEPNKYSQFKWTGSELIALDTKLNSYLKYDGTLDPIVGHDEYAGLNECYTVAPVKGTNYYYLMIKFAEVPCEELEGNETVKADLIEKLLEELQTENNINKMIYENRNNAGLQIFDKYLEAIYEYNYDTFFTSTLKLSEGDYDAFEISKKKSKEVVASFKAGEETVEITAEQLFNSLEEKYGVSTIISALNQYQVVGNDELNKFYNPYTEKVHNKKALKELLEGEVSSFRKNFELDYFTYSYLSYYGFIPNFPASYGWNDFRVDYFGAQTDRDLLVSSNFGGYVYNNALEALKDKVYPNMDELVKAEMDKAQADFYSLNVLNLIVSIDTNYDGTYDTNDVEGDDDNWTKEQNEKAVELAELIYEKAPETLKATLSDQLSAVVTEYNEAATDDATWGEYKALGLVVKFETSQTYTNSSSLVEEFLDQLSVLWDKIEAADLVGETLDSPLLSEKPFESSYGYHHIAVTGSTKATELPTDEQIAAYKAYLDYTEVKDLTYKFMEDEIEAAKKAYKDALVAAGLEVEENEDGQITTTLDETTTKLLQSTYDAAVSEVEGGDELTNNTLDYLTKGVEGGFSFKDKNDEKINLLKVIIEITKEDLAKDAEGGNK